LALKTSPSNLELSQGELLSQHPFPDKLFRGGNSNPVVRESLSFQVETAGSFQALLNQALLNQALLNQALLNQALLNQALLNQALSLRKVPRRNRLQVDRASSSYLAETVGSSQALLRQPLLRQPLLQLIQEPFLLPLLFPSCFY
jgi:hypothetical protein